jgi:hypothetical protein
MAHRVDGNSVVIDFDPNSKNLSKSGKTFVLATSNGFATAKLADGSDIMISYNICKKTGGKHMY